MNPPLDDNGSYLVPTTRSGTFPIKGRENHLPEGLNVGPSWADPPLLGISQRLPPSNMQAEQSLLGSILANNKAFNYVEEFLLPEHFVDATHGRIFGAIKRRIEAGQLADAVTLKQEFENDGELADVGGAAYLAQLLTAMVGIINAGEYGRAIKEAWVRRELIAAGEDLVNRAFDPEEIPAEAAAFAASTVDSIAAEGTTQKASTLGDVVQLALAMSKKANANGGFIGVRTGCFDKLDRKLLGLAPGDVMYVGARPGMGKTGFALGLSNGIAETENLPVLFVSREMTKEQLAMRNLSMATGIPLDDIRSGSWMNGPQAAERTRLIGDAGIHLGKLPLHFVDKGVSTVEGIRTQARLLKRKHKKLGAIVIDYLQLLHPPRGVRLSSANDRIAYISNSLKELAKDTDCPVVALSQLSRAVESREDKRPQLSDLRDSGAIEQDGDTVMFLYRDAYYLAQKRPKPDPTMSDSEYQTLLAQWQADMAAIEHKAEFILAKNRHGSTWIIDMGWDGPHTKFYDIGDHAHG